MDGLIGRRLANKYEVQAEIGRGGMGIVYRGYDARLQRPVAIKVLPREFTYDQQFVARFGQEAIMAARLHHANIVTIHDVGEEDHVHYIVMQFLEGVTLDQWLGQRGPMSLSQAGHILDQVANALDYAHDRGIIHRDIKPSNIMISSQGHATLMDFGLVRAGEGTQLTRSGMVVGTPEYMAPEQALGETVDARTDIYSLGVVLYKMLSGQVPFARSTSMATAYAHVHEPPPPLRERRPDMPAGVEPVVFKALAKRPDDRYQQASDLASHFSEASSGHIPAGVLIPAAGKPSPPPREVTPASESTRLVGSSTPAEARPPAGERHATPVPAPRGKRMPALFVAGLAVVFLMVLVGVALSLANRQPTPRSADGGSGDGSSAGTPLMETPGGVAFAATSTPTTAPTSTPAIASTETPATPTSTSMAVETEAPTATRRPPTHTPTRQAPTATRRPPTDTPTPQPPTATRQAPTATPTARPPTSTPTPAATATATPQPPTATPAQLSVPALGSPADGAQVIGQTTFSWNWSGPELASNEAFEVRLWKEGQPDHYGATGPVRSTSVTFDVASAYGVQQGGSGEYLWTVAVVEVDPYRRVGDEAPPRRITVEAGGGGGAEGPAPTPTPR